MLPRRQPSQSEKNEPILVNITLEKLPMLRWHQALILNIRNLALLKL